MSRLRPDPRAERIVRTFERLAPATLDELAGIYAADARFKDPFNDVQGLARIRGVYSHMFETLLAPRFAVHQAATSADVCLLEWELAFTALGSGRPWRIRGASRLTLDPEGRIREHRDYWDPAEELYEQVPALGWLMRRIRRRLAAPV